MARQIMCSCDSKNLYEMRASGNTAVYPDTAVVDTEVFKFPGVASFKSPAGCNFRVDLVTENPWANEWWLKFFFRFKSTDRLYVDRPVLVVGNNHGTQTYFGLVALGDNKYTLTIYTGYKYSETLVAEPCCEVPMVEDTWYEVLLYVKHGLNGAWGIWINGSDNVNGDCGNRNGCSGGPQARCNICNDCVRLEKYVWKGDPPWGVWWIEEEYCCQSSAGCLMNCCEHPAFNAGFLGRCTICECNNTQLYCHDTDDACYPRHQTKYGSLDYANYLFFGTEDGGEEGFDYWFDDIMFNDLCPYKHDNPRLPDLAVGTVRFGGRLTLLQVNAAGDLDDFTPVGTANNWENVDEVPPVSTDYNSATTLEQRDLYNIESATGKIG